MAGRTIFTYKSTGRPSLESIFGWRSQYERLGRWRERLRSADNSLDFLLAFFLNCYALRDWLVNESVLESTIIDGAIQADFHMSSCRDLCHRSKHLVLSRPSLFSFITQNWRGKPLVSYQTIVQLIASTTTRTGLNIKCMIDPNTYPAGVKLSDADMATLNITPHEFHGEWNYTLAPRPP